MDRKLNLAVISTTEERLLALLDPSMRENPSGVAVFPVLCSLTHI